MLPACNDSACPHGVLGAQSCLQNSGTNNIASILLLAAAAECSASIGSLCTRHGLQIYRHVVGKRQPSLHHGDCVCVQYTSRAAQLYKQQLEKDVAKFDTSAYLAGLKGKATEPAPVTAAIKEADQEAAATNGSSSSKPASQNGSATNLAALDDSSVESAPASSNVNVSATSAQGAKPVAPRAPPKPRMGSARRPAGKSGGLGVKRMATKVDESLFDQAPEEATAPSPIPVVSLHSSRRYTVESREISPLCWFDPQTICISVSTAAHSSCFASQQYNTQTTQKPRRSVCNTSISLHDQGQGKQTDCWKQAAQTLH